MTETYGELRKASDCSLIIEDIEVAGEFAGGMSSPWLRVAPSFTFALELKLFSGSELFELFESPASCRSMVGPLKKSLFV